LAPEPSPLNLYRAVFKQARDPILIVDGPRLRDANAAAASLWAAPDRASLLACTLSELVAADSLEDEPHGATLAERLARTQQPGHATYTWRLRRWDGTAPDVEIRATPHEDVEGPLLVYVQPRHGASPDATLSPQHPDWDHVLDRGSLDSNPVSVLKEKDAIPPEAQEGFVRQLLQSLGEGVFGVDSDGRFTFLNAAAYRMLGFAEESAAPLGRNAHELTHHSYPDGSPFPAEACPIDRVRRTGEPLDAWEDHFWRADGTSFPVLVYAAPLPNVERGRAGAVVSFQDLSERVAKERRYRLAQEAARFGIWEWDLDADRIYWDSACWEMIGYDPTAQASVLRYADWRAQVHPADLEQAEAVVQEQVARGEPFTVEFRYRRADGGWRWVQGRGQVTRWAPDGGPGYVMGVHMPIDQLKEKERAQKQLTAILESTPDLVSIANPDGRILYLNRAGRKMLGVPQSSQSPSSWSEAPSDTGELFVGGSSSHPAWASRLICDTGIPTALSQGWWEDETAILDAAGEEIAMSQVILAHYDEHGEALRISTILRDLRPQKVLQHRLEQHQELLGQLLTIVGSASPLEEKLHAILRLGTSAFGLPYAVLGRVDESEYAIRAAVTPDGPPQPGQRLDLDLACSTHISAASGPVGAGQLKGSRYAHYPCYWVHAIEAYLGVPVQVSDAQDGALLFYSHEPREAFSDFEWQLLRLMGQWLTYELTNEAQRHALVREAITDHLTELFNRQHFEAELHRSLAQVRRHGRAMGLLLFDIDYFKALNDRYGHACGDQALVEIARRVRGMLRDTDLLSRWGGEEFTVILPESEEPGIRETAERLRTCIEAHPLAETGSITISVGATQLQGDDDLNSAVRRVDDALYAAKRQGRNRVVYQAAPTGGE